MPFFVYGVSKIYKISSPSPFLNRIGRMEDERHFFCIYGGFENATFLYGGLKCHFVVYEDNFFVYGDFWRVSNFRRFCIWVQIVAIFVHFLSNNGIFCYIWGLENAIFYILGSWKYYFVVYKVKDFWIWEKNCRRVKFWHLFA